MITRRRRAQRVSEFHLLPFCLRRLWCSQKIAGISRITFVLLLCLMLISLSSGFECFTGDKDIMRRKQCPALGSKEFTDICFKRIGDKETLRGCFNSVIGALMLDNDKRTVDMGCHQVPKMYGTGTICFCDTELCNSAPPRSNPWASLLTGGLLALVAPRWLQRHVWG